MIKDMKILEEKFHKYKKIKKNWGKADSIIQFYMDACLLLYY